MNVVPERFCPVKARTALWIGEDVVLDDVPWYDGELAVIQRVQGDYGNLNIPYEQALASVMLANTPRAMRRLDRIQ